MSNFFSAKPFGTYTVIFIVRVITGLFLIYHGREVFDAAKMNEYAQWDMFKNSPSGKFLVYLGKGAEFIAGILLTFGLFTRIGALITIGTLAYITFFIGNGKIWADDQYPFMFVLLGLLFLFAGPGKFSLDEVLFKQRQ
ncbi:MAG: DoxX family protein [Ginsengibacter sp.]